jgi:hypothetical protein
MSSLLSPDDTRYLDRNQEMTYLSRDDMSSSKDSDTIRFIVYIMSVEIEHIFIIQVPNSNPLMTEAASSEIAEPPSNVIEPSEVDMSRVPV